MDDGRYDNPDGAGEMSWLWQIGLGIFGLLAAF